MTKLKLHSELVHRYPSGLTVYPACYEGDVHPDAVDDAIAAGAEPVTVADLDGSKLKPSKGV